MITKIDVPAEAADETVVKAHEAAVQFPGVLRVRRLADDDQVGVDHHTTHLLIDHEDSADIAVLTGQINALFA